MTARFLTVGFMLTAAMVYSVPASSPAHAASKAAAPACRCADAPIKARPKAWHHRAARQARSQAYAEGFYNYWNAAPVRMTGWHGEWRQAPNDWVAPAAYAGNYGPPPADYGPPPAYGEEAGLQIDKNGWSGGVGGFDGGGGGGGGVGLAIIAQGGRGLNGPTYNDYGQSFQNNPSQAGPFQNRLMGGFAPPPSSGGSSGGGSN